MGWILNLDVSSSGSRLAPSAMVDELPGLSVVSLQLPWSAVEQREGRLQWSVIDGAVQRWISQGRRVALRFPYGGPGTPSAAPQKLRATGRRGMATEKAGGASRPRLRPVPGDGALRAELDAFVASAAARYDGNPNIAFVDVGSPVGLGEVRSGGTARRLGTAVVRSHVDIYRRHFRRTLLALSADLVARDGGLMRHARERGLALVCTRGPASSGRGAAHGLDLAGNGGWTGPVILACGCGGTCRRASSSAVPLSAKAVERCHASYVSIDWPLSGRPAEWSAVAKRINMRLGYRLQLAEASWNARVSLGEPVRFSSTWQNAGVASVPGGGFVALTLKDARGGIAAVFVDEAHNVRDLPVAGPGAAARSPFEAAFAPPFNLATGVYGVYVSVGSRIGTPVIGLPLDRDDGARRYRLGEIRVTGDYALRVESDRLAADGWHTLPAVWTAHHPLPEGVAPFLHFDADGRIAFTGEAVEPRRLAVGSQTRMDLRFRVPREAWGRTFTVWAGLWNPQRIGQPDERLRPDTGGDDRRVPVGTLAVDGDGAARLLGAGAASGPVGTAGR